MAHTFTLKTAYHIMVDTDDVTFNTVIHEYDSIEPETAQDTKLLVAQVREVSRQHKTQLEQLTITRHRCFSVIESDEDGEIISTKNYMLHIERAQRRSKTQEISLVLEGHGTIDKWTEVIAQTVESAE